MLGILSFIASNFLYLFLKVSYTQGFPPPLSPKEEAECFARMKEGDMSARSRLIEHNLRLVAHIVKKYYTQNQNQDDLISIGTIGLIKGINTFDSSKNSKLASYISRCIENEILMYFRREKKHAGQVSLQEPIGHDDDGNEVSLMDILQADSDDICEEMDKNNMIKRILDRVRNLLTQREREIILLRYGLGGSEPLTQREVAGKLGISRSYVSRIEKKALCRLKD